MARRRYNYDSVLRSIIEYKTRYYGDSPTIRKLLEITGVKSTSNMVHVLEELHKEGKIQYGHIRGHIRIIGSEWIGPNKS